MTRRGDKEVSESRSRTGENERQPMMARLAAWWRRSNMVILATLEKENHPSEAQVRRGRRKALYGRESDSLEGPHKEAEIQRKALRRGKNLAFSEDTCLEKETVRSKVAPRKVEVGLKRRRELSRRRLGWRLAWSGSTEKKKASHLLGLKGRREYSDQRSNRIRDPCVAYSSGGRRVGGPNDQIVSLKKAADGRKQRSRKIIDEEREKNKAKN